MSKYYWPEETYIEGRAFKLNSLAWMNAFPNFSPAELADEDGKVKILKTALINLQLLRLEFGAPLRINSAYRSPAHNARVGGGESSLHIHGHAFDISLFNPRGGLHSGPRLEALARKYKFNGIGRYPKSDRAGWIHIDMRDRGATWGPRNWGGK